MRIGCDLVYVPRVKERIAEAVLTDKERLDMASCPEGKRLEFLAGRFAAKEAVMKAYGVGMKGMLFTEIEVSYDENGAPYATYKGQRIAISISHDGDYAYAVALLGGEKDE